MAFMALFGWILIPIILLYLLIQAVAAPLVWAAAHTGVINAAAAVLLVLNLLFFFLLLRLRAKRKRAGKRKGIVTLLAALWEAWVVFLCALFLIVQPLRFIPQDFGKLYMTEDSYGTWTITSCQGTTPGCTQSQEEIDAFLGQQIAYSEDKFVSTDWAYPLEDKGAYQFETLWQERFPPLYSLTLEDLDISKRNLPHIQITLPEGTGEDSPLGQELFILDMDTLMLYRKGVFYRAERTDQPAPQREDRPIPPKIRDLSAPAYFGTWKVTECLGTAPEEPMEQELIDKVLGAELEYQAGHLLFQRTDYGGGAGEPEYEESEMTAEAFQEACGVSLESLGVEPGTYLYVTVSVWHSESFFEDLGGRFLLLDEETMLLCSKGAFFRAELVPDSWPMIFDPDFELPVPNA